MSTPTKNPSAVALGKLGGSKNSAAQNAARARNASLGGKARAAKYKSVAVAATYEQWTPDAKIVLASRD
jgi:hypothetical protein